MDEMGQLEGRVGYVMRRREGYEKILGSKDG